jgi:hypothetical protein
VKDRAAFRTAATVCVLLCLIWDFANVVLFVELPLQLAAIGLLYWGADGLFGMGLAGSAQCQGDGRDRRPDASGGGRRPAGRPPTGRRQPAGRRPGGALRG